MDKHFDIAIVGSGPRGMAVLERLSYLLDNEDNLIVNIYLIDNISVGTGRIWRTDQSPMLIMNTIAQEISAFSGQWNGKNISAGNGPSFGQWAEGYEKVKYNNYFPRLYYGKYLLFILDTLEKNYSDNIKLHKIKSEVEDLNIHENKVQLLLDNGEIIYIDKVVLATGHQRNKLNDFTKRFKMVSSKTKGLKFFEGDSVADMQLQQIKAGEDIGIIGMGLGFYDLMAEFTIGRGGEYKVNNLGKLTYVPSGDEPRIYAGNNSGLPVLSRGVNQKPYNYEYSPAIFNLERVRKLKENGKIEFNKEIIPLINAEINLVFTETSLVSEGELELANQLRENVIRYGVDSIEGLKTISFAMGIRKYHSIDIYELTFPFKNLIFSSLDDFNDVLSNYLTNDYKEAQDGNVNSPLKAALDVLRNIRPVIREAVDYGGLEPISHDIEFLQRFVPLSNFLSAGPPSFRIAQLNALIKSGVITIIGPKVNIRYVDKLKVFSMQSIQVINSEKKMKVLIDSRLPRVDILRERSNLTKSLLNKGIYTPFVNKSNESNSEIVLGGVNVTRSPFHPIGIKGEIYEQLYVTGIPTEHIRWFMQSGSTRPNKWNDFMQDADDIAKDILKDKVIL